MSDPSGHPPGGELWGRGLTKTHGVPRPREQQSRGGSLPSRPLFKPESTRRLPGRATAWEHGAGVRSRRPPRAGLTGSVILPHTVSGDRVWVHSQRARACRGSGCVFGLFLWHLQYGFRDGHSDAPQRGVPRQAWVTRPCDLREPRLGGKTGTLPNSQPAARSCFPAGPIEGSGRHQRWCDSRTLQARAELKPVEQEQVCVGDSSQQMRRIQETLC